MKKILMILSLLVTGSVAQSSELDDLINTSSSIANQIDRGTKLVGAAMQNSYSGYVSEAGLADTAKISPELATAYNEALINMSNYQPYGDAQTFLENKAADELVLMNQAIDDFSEAVVAISTVIEVADMAETASSPAEEANVQSYVENNVEALQISQEDVSQYNQSLEDIETHANNAGAYLGVSKSKEAVAFLDQGAVNNNVSVNDATAYFNVNQQWVSLSWGNGNATAVYINGNNWQLDLYKTEAEVLLAGESSEYYLSSPSNFYGSNQ